MDFHLILDKEERKKILSPFGHSPCIYIGTILGDELSRISRLIRDITLETGIDWSTLYTPVCLKKDYFLTPEYYHGYFNFKYAVAKALQPDTIVEIGVGAGHSALAFLRGSPSAIYLGIDDGSKAKEEDFNYFKWIKERGEERVHFKIQDSMTLELAGLPTSIDLFHVDGGHDFDHAYHDIKLAIELGSKNILIDDAHDPIVTYAAMKALYELGGYKYLFFEDTFTGNLLLTLTTGEANG